MQNKTPLDGILLVSDVDGTLITKDFTVPQRNIAAVKRFEEEGGYFAIATGRPELSADKYLTQIKINAPSILYNGSAIYDFSNKKMVWNAFLPKESRILAGKVKENFPDVGIEVYSEGCIYILNLNSWTQKHIIDEKFPYKITDIGGSPAQWLKILFACDNVRLLQVLDYIKALGFGGIHYVFSNYMFLEGLPEGVSKGTSLLKLSEMLGVRYEDVFAIGDYYNDIDLISTAGNGVTVENAPDEVKRVAGMVTCRCENGAVADLIEYIEITRGKLLKKKT